MASQGELMARMEWLVGEVEKKGTEMRRKHQEHQRVMAEKVCPLIQITAIFPHSSLPSSHTDRTSA